MLDAVEPDSFEQPTPQFVKLPENRWATCCKPAGGSTSPIGPRGCELFGPNFAKRGVCLGIWLSPLGSKFGPEFRRPNDIYRWHRCSSKARWTFTDGTDVRPRLHINRWRRCSPKARWTFTGGAGVRPRLAGHLPVAPMFVQGSLDIYRWDRCSSKARWTSTGGTDVRPRLARDFMSIRPFGSRVARHSRHER